MEDKPTKSRKRQRNTGPTTDSEEQSEQGGKPTSFRSRRQAKNASAENDTAAPSKTNATSTPTTSSLPNGTRSSTPSTTTSTTTTTTTTTTSPPVNSTISADNPLTHLIQFMQNHYKNNLSQSTGNGAAPITPITTTTTTTTTNAPKPQPPPTNKRPNANQSRANNSNTSNSNAPAASSRKPDTTITRLANQDSNNQKTNADQNHSPANGSNSTSNNKEAANTSHRGSLDGKRPLLSFQYEMSRKEDGTWNPALENADDHFLLAARHELQAMESEVKYQKKLQDYEKEVEKLQKGIAMRDRVIRKLQTQIDEKDASMPFELVSNWVAASRAMADQRYP